jgi:uncharacterized repeat protein (TIGR01451 family)
MAWDQYLPTLPRKRLRPVVRALSCAIGLLCAVVLGAAAQAQTTTVSNTTVGTINNTTTCTAPLVRNFVVGANYIVGDVDLALLATHSWRGDVQVTLQSPLGTRVQLVNGDTVTISGDNFNVRLDDAASQFVNSDSATGNHATTAPPYQNQFRPNASLSVFGGENSAGLWRLEICDLFPGQDNGNFVRADLYLTQAPATYADLSLAKTVSNMVPTSGASISYGLTVTNAAASPLSATGVTVTDVLPPGVAFVSASGAGSYNAGTGIWTVGTLAPGASASLTITVIVTASNGATITNSAEVRASLATDIDSMPNNGSTSEDDDAQISFTVSGTRTAGTPPVLTCPVTVLHDWDSVTWAAGSTVNSYAITGIGTVAWSITNDGAWQSNATYGGPSRRR